MSGQRAPERETSWERARDRLAAAAQVLREAAQPSPARARALLEARAQRLAEPLPEAPRPGELLDVAVFSLARERYAIETRLIREIARFADFTPVPGAADFLIGVTNLRGAILAVVDLRRIFGVAQNGLTDQSRVLRLGHARADPRKDLGVLADETHDVVSVRADGIFAAGPTAPSVGRDYIRGVTEDAIIVLDGDKLLRDPRLVIDHSEAIRRSERPD
jgi:purine-binding chemotaxis protein CheW